MSIKELTEAEIMKDPSGRMGLGDDFDPKGQYKFLNQNQVITTEHEMVARCIDGDDRRIPTCLVKVRK